MISEMDSIVLSAQIHTLNTEYYFLSLLCMHTCKHMRIKTAHSAKMQKNLFFFCTDLWQIKCICGNQVLFVRQNSILRCCFFSHSLVITLKISWHWVIVFSYDLIHLRFFILETSRTLMVMCSILYGYKYTCMFLSFLRNFLS